MLQAGLTIIQVFDSVEWWFGFVNPNRATAGFAGYLHINRHESFTVFLKT